GDGGGVFGDNQFTSTLSVNFHFPRIPRRTIKKADKVGQRRAYAQENNLEDDRVNDLRNTRGVYQEENFSFDRTRRNSEHPIVPSCLPGRTEQPPFSFSQTLQT
ncbi:hypothetical protein, partial [Aeromonas sp. HZM]|uniref:hypothetical protein n=1 Tax=Aeromonas sp. HZM TaxID=1454008 RepID=UPI001F368AF8